MKWAFQLAFHEAATKDDRLILIFGDVGYTMFRDLRKHLPRQCINAGLCEQAMVSMAAGMAMEGYRPVLYTIMPFLLERAFEQIKLDIDQMCLPVGLVGYSDDTAGPTHIELDFWRMTALLRHTLAFQATRKEDVATLLNHLLTSKSNVPWILSLQP